MNSRIRIRSFLPEVPGTEPILMNRVFFSLLVLLVFGCTQEARGTGIVAKCDRSAAADFDYQRKAPPVSFKNFNSGKAERLCRQALEKESQNPRLLFQLGHALVVNNEVEKAKSYLSEAADRGYPAAEYYLGLYHEKGWTKKVDLGKALQWYLSAAKNGHRDAQFSLGRMYETGRGVEKSAIEALRWYKRSAEQGHTVAMYATGTMYYGGGGIQENLKLAASFIKDAAEDGLVQAQHSLAQMYMRGHGVQQSMEQALHWFELSASKGYAVAQLRLGDLYYEGQSIARNPQEATKWFCSAGDVGKQHFKRKYNEQLSCK